LTEELDTAVADSIGGWFRARHKPAHSTTLGSPCANCGEILLGPWCHACGQHSENYHRSLRHLIAEAFESLFHFDGRLWRTLPDLTLRPDRLTKNFLAGHRAPQIPPLRLFLITLLLVFVTGSIHTNISSFRVGDHGQLVASPNATPDPNATAEVKAQLADANCQVEQALPPQALSIYRATSGWLIGRLKAVAGDPERFLLILENWGERFAFLALPMSTLLLSVLFIARRKFFVFDHAIFSLHSLSAMGLLLSLVFVLERLAGTGAWLLLAAPIHLFRHMRGVYGTGVASTLIRMALLFMGSVIGFGLIVTGLLAVGLTSMG